MKRRDFLKRGLATAGGAVLLGRATGQIETADNDQTRQIKQAKTTTPGGFYTPSRAPLQPTAFQRLPIGSITPKGWLREQLVLQANGLNGRMPEVSDYLKYDGNGWVTPGSNVGWEEVPYWLRGFGDLGYVLGDQRVITLATKWLTGIISSQQADGWFGPSGARKSLDGGPDLWPHMPILRAMQSYYEYTKDPQVIPFLTKFFQLENTVPGPQFNKSWAGVRWGDTLDTLFWLYNRTGDAFLLDLAQKIHTNSADWTTGVHNWHNVNISQGFREPTQYWLASGDPTHYAAAENNYQTVMGLYGQFAGGGFAGDENCRPGFGDPRQGFETCGIVELMQSFEMLTLLTGDPVWADRCEYITFNSMPAAFDPEQKGCHYITSANSVQLDGQAKGNDFNNNWPMQIYEPGIHNYRCCPHNYGMGWPQYAENAWLATVDNGLCASLYAPSEVRAKVGDGTEVKMALDTEYPFRDTVQMTLTTPKSITFPLYLRIPNWCQNPTIKINGKAVSAHATSQSYLILNRAWKNGDKVSLHLPMAVSVRTWDKNKDAISIDRGPLTFSLAVQEDWTRDGGTDQWPHLGIKSASPWNYGLVLDKHNPAHSFDVTTKGGPVAPNPFTHKTNPVELRARAKKIPQWQADKYNVVGLLQQSPALTTERTETITLIPMGAARLRITTFPTVGTGPDANVWVAPRLPEWKTTASFASVDSVDAISDGLEPSSSYDQDTPRFTWWDHKGTQEWVQYDYPKPIQASAISVYWYDDTGHGQCRVPQSWRLLYKTTEAGDWKPVENASSYGTALNQYNRVTFAPITALALRLEAQLQDGFSAGILEWKIDPMNKATAPKTA